MQIKTYLITALVVLITFSSCEKIAMTSPAKTDPQSIFQEYAKLVKEKYAMLDFKGVDIDHLTDSIGALVQDGTSNTELLGKLAIITYRLRDAHSSLTGGGYQAGFNPFAGYSVGLDWGILVNNYLGASVGPGIHTIPAGVPIVGPGEVGQPIHAAYGVLSQGNNIGYMHIPSFNVDISDAHLETMFQGVHATSGLILDVRGNGGGSPELATKVASYFMSAPTYTGFERFKTGPGASDFTDSPSTIQPISSDYRYLKPVMVLTDRGVYSATTTLCYNLDPLPNVTFVGQRSGGGSGSTADGYLANGWQWQLSTSEFIDYQGRHLDDGFDPDIAVALDIMVPNLDEVLERAILELM